MKNLVTLSLKTNFTRILLDRKETKFVKFENDSPAFKFLFQKLIRNLIL